MVARALLVVLALATLATAARAQQPAPPGAFDYYLLALSWSPAYCLAHRDDPRAHDECARHRGFIVHGLWPQDEDGTWPAYCTRVPPVPPGLVDHEADTMPNADMVRHEWEKHGSCSGLPAPRYFAALDDVFARLRLPPALVAPKEALTLPLAEAKSLFVSANPGLDETMFAMRCAHGNAVDEVRLCLDKSFKFRACGSGTGDSCPIVVHFDPISGSRE